MFEITMKKIKSISIEAANWMLDPEIPKRMWTRHTIDFAYKFVHVTTNVTKSVNRLLGDDINKEDNFINV